MTGAARVLVTEKTGGSETVLVVDDDRFVRQALQEILRDHGYRPIGVATGIECLDYLVDNTVDIILLDLSMPDIDGASVYRCLRRAGDVTPILLITARPFCTEAYALLQEGLAGVLSKPLDEQALITQMQGLLA